MFFFKKKKPNFSKYFPPFLFSHAVPPLREWLAAPQTPRFSLLTLIAHLRFHSLSSLLFAQRLAAPLAYRFVLTQIRSELYYCIKISVPHLIHKSNNSPLNSYEFLVILWMYLLFHFPYCIL